MTTTPRIRIRVQLGDQPLFGPGKASLLKAIAEAGSISGAARQIGMSYRRAWLLVDSMNRNFVAPLVEATSGGGGGARITPLGEEVLTAYHEVEERAHRAAGDSLSRLERLLSDNPSTDGLPEQE